MVFEKKKKEEERKKRTRLPIARRGAPSTSMPQAAARRPAAGQILTRLEVLPKNHLAPPRAGRVPAALRVSCGVRIRRHAVWSAPRKVKRHRAPTAWRTYAVVRCGGRPRLHRAAKLPPRGGRAHAQRASTAEKLPPCRRPTPPHSPPCGRQNPSEDRETFNELQWQLQ